MTLQCRAQVLLRNSIFHLVIFPSYHQILMAHSVEWVMDSPMFEWEHDPSTNTIVATTSTVVRTYVHLGHVQEGVAPDVPPFFPPAPVVFPGAYLGQPLGLWDFPPEPLPDFPPEPQPDIPMEPISPGLPVAEP